MYTQPVPYFDANGKLLPYLLEARKRGVKFDVGHGGGSFSWSKAIPAIRKVACRIRSQRTCTRAA